ncbi:MAG: nitrilase-related carbon-nitrogen hydrolase [Oscillospiraceae bacterium]
MPSVRLSIVNTLSPPPEGAELVIFSDPRNYTAEYDSGRMLTAAARYARRYKVFVLPERFIAEDYLCLCLLGPDGVPLGVQRATHLNLDYRGRFRRADTVAPFDTPFGRVALLVDVDVNMPQVPRAAVLAGAELLLSSQFIQLFDFFEDRIRYGAINAARSNGVAVAAAAGAGGVIVGPDGEPLAGYTEELPLSAPLTPAAARIGRDELMTGYRLLAAHRALLIEETGGAPLEQG